MPSIASRNVSSISKARYDTCHIPTMTRMVTRLPSQNDTFSGILSTELVMFTMLDKTQEDSCKEVMSYVISNVVSLEWRNSARWGGA